MSFFESMSMWKKKKRVKPAEPCPKKESILHPSLKRISELKAGEGAVIQGTVVSASPLIVQQDHSEIEIVPSFHHEFPCRENEHIQAAGFVTKRNGRLVLKASRVQAME